MLWLGDDEYDPFNRTHRFLDESAVVVAVQPSFAVIIITITLAGSTIFLETTGSAHFKHRRRKRFGAASEIGFGKSCGCGGVFKFIDLPATHNPGMARRLHDLQHRDLAHTTRQLGIIYEAHLVRPRGNALEEDAGRRGTWSSAAQFTRLDLDTGDGVVGMKDVDVTIWTGRQETGLEVGRVVGQALETVAHFSWRVESLYSYNPLSSPVDPERTHIQLGAFPQHGQDEIGCSVRQGEWGTMLMRMSARTHDDPLLSAATLTPFP